MTEELIIAGFGGQGVLAMGKILAYSGIIQGMEVSWMPSYGPEMRGGTANVTVIMGDEKISSPIINDFDSAIIMNQQSLDKFEGSIRPGGILIYDTNGITRHPKRKDIKIYQIEAAQETIKLASARVLNMVVMGAYLNIKPVLSFENVKEGLKRSLHQRHHHLLEINEKAIKRGMEIVEEVV